MPICLVHRFLEISAIKFTITQEDNLGPFWNPFFDQIHQFDVKCFGSMTLGAFAHHPGQRQGTAFIDGMHHQHTTTSTHGATIHDQDQSL